MLASLRSYHPMGKTFFAFEHAAQEEDTIILGIEVKQKKDELDLIQHFTVTDLSEISDTLKTTIAANLSITDSNVLCKTISQTGTDQDLLSEAYPNLTLDDFYYQILRTATKSFVAVCRKAYVDGVVSQYKDVNINCIAVDLGVLRTSSLTDYISSTTIQTYNSSLEIIDKEIATMLSSTGTSENYSIDSITLPSTHTVPFAIVLARVSNQTNISGNIEEKNTELRQAYKDSQFFKKTLQFGIAFLLIALLINFFVFNSSYKNLQNLQEEQQIFTTQKELIKQQQSIVTTKEAIVNSIANTGFSKSSLYIHQIIQSQPGSILLTSFAYQPITKTIRNDKPIVFEEKTIQITGNSIDELSFTNWLHGIESLPYVSAVKIVSYGLTKKNTAGFEIVINLIDDTEK